MDYPYKEVSRDIFRPIIPVFLHFKGNMIGYEALLDSGADLNIFHADIARALDIELKSGEKHNFAGINGTKSTAFIHKIELEAAGQRFITPIAFSDDISDSGYGVLGQYGFFSEFTIKFTFYNLQVRVSKRV